MVKNAGPVAVVSSANQVIRRTASTQPGTFWAYHASSAPVEAVRGASDERNTFSVI